MTGALELLALVIASGLAGAGIAAVVLRRPKSDPVVERRAEPGTTADANIRMACWNTSARIDIDHEENLRRARRLYDFIAANEIALPHCMEGEPEQPARAGDNITPFPPRPVA